MIVAILVLGDSEVPVLAFLDWLSDPEASGNGPGPAFNALSLKSAAPGGQLEAEPAALARNEERDPDDVRLARAFLQAMADRQVSDTEAFGSVPALQPPASRVEAAGGPTWRWVSDGSEVSPAQLTYAMTAGLAAERSMLSMDVRRLAGLRDRAKRLVGPDAMRLETEIRLLSAQVAVERDRAKFACVVKSRLEEQGERSFFQAIVGSPVEPDWSVMNEGLVAARQQEAVLVDPTDLSAIVRPSEIGPTSDCETKRWFLKPGADDVVGRLARLSKRLEEARDGPHGGVGYSAAGSIVDALVAKGEPGDRQASVRVLSETEHGQVFGRAIWSPGSVSEPGFRIPVGSVLVLVDAEPAYIRGRGWRIGPDRKLFAWDPRGEPGLPMQVGGIDADGCSRPGEPYNPLQVPLRGWASFAGARWLNVLGDGWLWDEDPLEWEDRRLRVRAQAWARLAHRSGPPLSGSEWRWITWSLAGHCGSVADWRLGSGGWRENPFAPALGESAAAEVVRYSVAPRTEVGDWRDPGHDAFWSRVGLSSDVPLSGASDFLAAWLEGVRESALALAADPVRRELFNTAMAAAVGDHRAFWLEAVAAKESAVEAEAGFTEAVAARREWMKANARLAYIPDPDGTGPLDGPGKPIEIVPWSECFAPEPFVPPAIMVFRDAEKGELFDFSTAPIPSTLSDEALFAAMASGRLGAATILPAGWPPGSALPGDPEEIILADARLLGLSREAMEKRFERIFGEAGSLLLVGDQPPLTGAW